MLDTLSTLVMVLCCQDLPKAGTIRCSNLFALDLITYVIWVLVSFLSKFVAFTALFCEGEPQ